MSGLVSQMAAIRVKTVLIGCPKNQLTLSQWIITAAPHRNQY